MSAPAAIRVERAVEWADTDASGHAHNGFAGRLLEIAESELMRRLDLADLVPGMPRVRLAYDFRRRLWFGDRAMAELRVAAVGRTSLTWAMVARGPDGEVAIEAEAVVVHAPGAAASPWPEEARARLEGAGDQGEQRLSDPG